MSFLWKRNSKNRKCCSFGKGTARHASVVPLEKEEQKSKMLFLWKRNNKTHKCHSFGKGTVKIENDVPLEKEQQKAKMKKKNKIKAA